MRKLYYRHPAFYLFDRYKPYHRLVRMSTPSEQQLGEGGPSIAVWRIGKGMRVGVLTSIADVLARYDKPTADFADEILGILREWMTEYPDHKGGLVDAAGVWGGEMETVAEMRVEGMWQRWLWRQQRLRILTAYVYESTRYLCGEGPWPNRKDFGISSDGAKVLRGRVRDGLDRHGARFDPRHVRIDDLV